MPFLLQQRVAKIFIQQSTGALFPLCLLALGGFFLNSYLEGTTTVLLAGAAAIAATTTKGSARKRYRFSAAIMLALTWLVPVSTLLYFAVGLLVFCWLEAQAFRIHFLGTVALLLSSPAFQYAAGAFSFPIRLQLTTLVGTIFSLFTKNIQLNGNLIFYEGREFAVDPACMGLHMLSLSLLLGIFLLGMLQKKAGKRISPAAALLFLVCLFLLNLAANVLRILLLVQFAVPPEASLHDVIGLLCLLLYVCVPACYLARFLVARASGNQAKEHHSSTPSSLLLWLLLAGFTLAAQRVKTVDTYAKFNGNYTQPVPGFASAVYAPGIVKLHNEKALIYVKFIRGFYDTEHNPGLCWRGSGYAFSQTKKQVMAGQEVYTAMLCSNNEKLYTAWWYGNGRRATTSQWEWRWDMLKGSEGYAVVNVTAATETALKEEVKKVLYGQSLAPLLRRK